MTNVKSRKQQGFTLIELVIVIAVIAILAGLLVPTILGQTERARISKGKSDVNEIAKSLARMRTDTGVATAACYQTLTNLALVAAPVSGDDCHPGATTFVKCTDAAYRPGDLCWGGPYFNPAPATDAWGNAYTVSYSVADKSITVTSGGPDGATTTTDDITVIQ